MRFSLVIGAGRVPGVNAQDATPPAAGFEIAPGVTAEVLPAVEDPPSLYRLHFAPRVTYEFADDPSGSVVVVDAGTLTLRLEAAVTLAWPDAPGGAGEQIAAGTEFTVTAGAYFLLPPLVAGEVRNVGEEAVTISGAGLFPQGLSAPIAGTPTTSWAVSIASRSPVPHHRRPRLLSSRLDREIRLSLPPRELPLQLRLRQVDHRRPAVAAGTGLR